MNNYRKCVGIVVINSKNEVFLGERIDAPNSWQLPQGGINEEENEISAVFRELHEETGIKSESPDDIEIIASLEKPIRYNIPSKNLPASWKNEFIGQEIRFYLLKFNGDDSRINLKNSEHPEFSRYKWHPIEDLENFLVKNTVEFKKEMYSEVARYFSETLKIVYA